MHRRIITASSTRYAEDGGATTTTFLASTGGEARDGHVIDQRGWQLDEYRANPVVLWAHDGSQPPIGRAVRAEVVGDGLEIEVAWDEGTDLGRTVARQYREGYLHAVSVGWQPLQATPRRALDPAHPAYSAQGGLLFERSVLLELSAVPVGADPMALARAGLLPPPPELDVDALRGALLDLLRHDDEVAVAVGEAERRQRDAAFWRALIDG